MRTTVSAKGQIVLPVEIRRQDRIEPGQEFDVERLDRGDYRLVRRDSRRNAGLIDWLTTRSWLDSGQPEPYNVGPYPGRAVPVTVLPGDRWTCDGRPGSEVAQFFRLGGGAGAGRLYGAEIGEQKFVVAIDVGGRTVTLVSGSPFEDVEYAGRRIRIGQCNNAYIFPGVGLGVIAVQARRVSDAMFIAAARTLSELAPVRRDPTLALLPPLVEVRDVAKRVAFAVAVQAQQEGLADPLTPDELRRRIDATMWTPDYLTYRRAR